MKVFISWSKERSLKVANALFDWLPQVINQVEPWMSASSLEAGKPSIAQISDALETTNFGIICVTPENQHETWLNFEAGALAKAVRSASASAIPLLVGFGGFGELDAPLSNYQAHMSSKADLKKIVHSINEALGSSKRPVAHLDKAFDMWWPELEEKLHEAEKWQSPETSAPVEDSGADKRFDQIIQAVKTLQRQVEELTVTVRSMPSYEPKRAALMRMLAEGRFDEAVPAMGYSEEEHNEVRGMLAVAGHAESTLMIGPSGIEIKTHELPSNEIQREIQRFMNKARPDVGQILFSTYDSDEGPSSA